MTNWIRAWWSRLTAGLALTVVASVTGVISYTHVYDLTVSLHQPNGECQSAPVLTRIATRGARRPIRAAPYPCVPAGSTVPYSFMPTESHPVSPIARE